MFFFDWLQWLLWLSGPSRGPDCWMSCGETCSISQLDNIDNASNSRKDFLNVLTAEHRHRIKSTKFPQCLDWSHQKTNKSTKSPQCFDWSHQKRTNSARLRHGFDADNIEKTPILRDFLQEFKVECRANTFVPMRLAIFPFHVSKVFWPARKSDDRSYQVLHLSRKIIVSYASAP